MKYRIVYGLIAVDFLTILLSVAILFIPSNIARIILGLPFLLFFPGYALMSALFIRSEEMNGIEFTALSFVTSIVIVALTGFGLNYTPWQIRLEPVLYSVTGLIITLSVVAFIRWFRLFNQTKSTKNYKSKLSISGKRAINWPLVIIIIVIVASAIGILGYTLAVPKTGEQFTQFYILDSNGNTRDYPTDFFVKQGLVVGVSYDAGMTFIDSNSGKVNLGIVNHEWRKVSYTVTTWIDSEQIKIVYDGKSMNELQMELQHGEKWEHEIEFTPQHNGDSQLVEFLLYKDGAPSPANTLHLWVNVKAA